MESWEKRHITKNLPELLNYTYCHPDLLGRLQSSEVLGGSDIDFLDSYTNRGDKVRKFYDIIQTRSGSYAKIKEALEATGQTGALSILESINRDNASTAFKNYETITYNKTEVIGEGISATVYKGKFGDRVVAVKKIKISSVNEETVLREVDILTKLDGHPNVVRYYSYKKDAADGFILIALELCHTNLGDWVKKQRTVDISVVNLLKQLTEGTRHLHSHRIVHRDLKPENILIADHSEGGIIVKISDFGLSRKILEGRSRLPHHSCGAGSDGWLAPEIAEQLNTETESVSVIGMSPASDIFALGCIFYFVLTEGVHPFGRPVERQFYILSGKHQLDAEKIKAVKGKALSFIWLIRHMLAHKDTERPSASVILSHHVFWSSRDTIAFIEDIYPFIDGCAEMINKSSELVVGPAISQNLSSLLSTNTQKMLDCVNSLNVVELNLANMLELLVRLRKERSNLPEDVREILGLNADKFLAYWESQFLFLLPIGWTCFQYVKEQSEIIKQFYHDDRIGFRFHLVSQTKKSFTIIPFPTDEVPRILVENPSKVPRNVPTLTKELIKPFQQNKPVESVLQKIRGLDNDINILLLGETGVGKSTWINSFSNMLKYSSLAEAEAGELIKLIPSEFTLCDENFDELQVSTGNDPNESSQASQSATKETQIYPFDIGTATVRLIDTPGFDDTRGTDQDKQNFQNILGILSHLNEIHGICVLLKPNNARLTIMFRYCIQELLTNLHRDASKNIMFCFTNSRGNYYRPGDCMPALKTLLKDKNVGINVSPQTVYCFDSEAYQFLAAIKNFPKVTFPDNERANAAQSWKQSISETKRMLEHIRDLPPYPIKGTLIIELALKMVRPLAEISRNIQVSKCIAMEKKQAIQKTYASFKELEKIIMTTRTQIKFIKLDYPKTICSNIKCMKIFSVKGVIVTQYVTICHDPCQCLLRGDVQDRIADPQLFGCVAMSNGICKKEGCGHSFREHIHVHYDTAQEVVEVDDQSVKESLDKNLTADKMKQRMIDEKNREIEEYEDELKEIRLASVTLAYFIRVNAIIPYNDEMQSYLDHLIREEEDKFALQGKRTVLDSLKASKDSYLSEKNVLDKSMAQGEGSPPTADEVGKLVEKLKKLKHSGEMLREALDCVNYSGSKTYDEKPTMSMGAKIFDSVKNSAGK